MKLHPLLLSLAASAFSSSDPQASLAAQTALLNTKNKFILTALSLNPNLEISVFKELLTSSSKKILNNLLSHKLSEEKLIEVLKLDLSDSQIASLVQSNNLTQEQIERLKNGPKTSTSILENQTIPFAVKNKHFDHASLKAQLIFLADYSEVIPTEQISKTLLSSNSIPAKNYPRLPLARLIHKKPEILDTITSSHPEPVITTASASPHLTTIARQKNLLKIITENNYQYAFMALTANPRFQNQLIDELSEEIRSTPLLLTYLSKKPKPNLNILDTSYAEITDKKTLTYLLKRALPSEYSLTGKIIDALLLFQNPVLKDDLIDHLRYLAQEYPYLRLDIIELVGDITDNTDNALAQADPSEYADKSILSAQLTNIKDLYSSETEILINELGSDIKTWENFITLLPDFQMDITTLIKTSKNL